MTKIRAIKEQLGAVLGDGNCYLMDHLIEVRRLDRQWLRRLLGKVQTGKVRAPQPVAIKQLESPSPRAKRTINPDLERGMPSEPRAIG
jgi:hypothetical protein